ncbi:MAG: hypothetical protein R3293_08500 [Candidatus Promineifilaceae bacterium]|nr:hypothetical protein [Candidatus Promineifilaceae bacterium]
MNPLSAKLGFWSAALAAAAFIIFSIAFIAIVLLNPLFIWTDFTAYVSYISDNNQLLKYVAQFCMLLFGPLFIILTNSIHDFASKDKKVLSRLAVYFSILFAGMITINYFVELSIVRQNLTHGRLEGLEQFVQANPASFITAVNMLGWTLFFGLSCLFLFPLFSRSRLQRIIRYALFANTLFMFLGGISYLFEQTVFVFIFMNFLMGGAVLVTTIALAILFSRQLVNSPSSQSSNRS